MSDQSVQVVPQIVFASGVHGLCAGVGVVQAYVQVFARVTE
jgi:hypothetical protein